MYRLSVLAAVPLILACDGDAPAPLDPLPPVNLVGQDLGQGCALTEPVVLPPSSPLVSHLQWTGRHWGLVHTSPTFSGPMPSNLLRLHPDGTVLDDRQVADDIVVEERNRAISRPAFTAASGRFLLTTLSRERRVLLRTLAADGSLSPSREVLARPNHSWNRTSTGVVASGDAYLLAWNDVTAKPDGKDAVAASRLVLDSQLRPVGAPAWFGADNELWTATATREGFAVVVASGARLGLGKPRLVRLDRQGVMIGQADLQNLPPLERSQSLAAGPTGFGLLVGATPPISPQPETGVARFLLLTAEGRPAGPAISLPGKPMHLGTVEWDGSHYVVLHWSGEDRDTAPLQLERFGPDGSHTVSLTLPLQTKYGASLALGPEGWMGLVTVRETSDRQSEIVFAALRCQ